MSDYIHWEDVRDRFSVRRNHVERVAKKYGVSYSVVCRTFDSVNLQLDCGGELTFIGEWDD